MVPFPPEPTEADIAAAVAAGVTRVANADDAKPKAAPHGPGPLARPGVAR
jgi:hypothetical protein